MEGRFELVDPPESDRWVAVRQDGSDMMICRHMHRTWEGVQRCAREWQAETQSSAATFGMYGVKFIGWDAESLSARFHSDVLDCGCPRCNGPAPPPTGLRIVIGEDKASGRMLVLPDDVSSAIRDWMQWGLILAQAVGFCGALLRQGATGPYRLYLCDGAGRILGSAPTGNPKLSVMEPGRPNMEDGILSGQMAWRDFGTVVQEWIAENRSLGELSFT
jgi:hypothetical protein